MRVLLGRRHSALNDRAPLREMPDDAVLGRLQTVEATDAQRARRIIVLHAIKSHYQQCKRGGGNFCPYCEGFIAAVDRCGNYSVRILVSLRGLHRPAAVGRRRPKCCRRCERCALADSEAIAAAAAASARELD